MPRTMSDATTIRIQGGIELEVPIGASDAHVRTILRALRAELPGLLGENAEARPELGELLERGHARSFGDRAGIVAFWLETHCGRSDWRSGDIVDALRDAGEEVPKNITDALNQKRDKGLFEVEDRRWKLSGEGRGWVKYSLLGEA